MPIKRYLGPRRWTHKGKTVGFGEKPPDRIVNYDAREGKHKGFNFSTPEKDERWTAQREHKLRKYLLDTGEFQTVLELDAIPAQARREIYKQLWRALLAARANHYAFAGNKYGQLDMV